MRSLRHPATIIASLALLASLVGTGYASGLINGRQIKNGTITGSKLANNTIPGSKLANNTIPLQKLTPTVVDGLNYILKPITGPPASLAPGQTGLAFAACPQNTFPIAGGFSASSSGATAEVYVQSEYASLSLRSWIVQVVNAGSSTVSLVVSAECVL